MCGSVYYGRRPPVCALDVKKLLIYTKCTFRITNKQEPFCVDTNVCCCAMCASARYGSVRSVSIFPSFASIKIWNWCVCVCVQAPLTVWHRNFSSRIDFGLVRRHLINFSVVCRQHWPAPPADKHNRNCVIPHTLAFRHGPIAAALNRIYVEYSAQLAPYVQLRMTR